MKTKDDCRGRFAGYLGLVVVSVFSVIGFAGCQQEGAAEKAGQKIDHAAKNAEQKIGQATDSAGRKIESAKESVAAKADTAGAYIDDSVVTAKVKAAIFNDPILKTSQIEVNTVKGVVTLRGTVDSQQSIDRAISVATSQEGVKTVQSSLIVNTQTLGKE